MGKTTETVNIEPLKETIMKIKITGDSDLILKKRSRYYEQSEVWKQAHDKGAEPPAIYKQGKNIWEPLITSIHWEKPIVFHDDDITLYTEKEWNDYMKNNRPCILATAFAKSFVEAFITFFKDSIKKNGTDIKRAINMIGKCYPVNFASVSVKNEIVPTNGPGGGSPVLCSYNLFSGWDCEIELSCPDVVFPYKTPPIRCQLPCDFQDSSEPSYTSNPRIAPHVSRSIEYPALFTYLANASTAAALDINSLYSITEIVIVSIPYPPYPLNNPAISDRKFDTKKII